MPRSERLSIQRVDAPAFQAVRGLEQYVLAGIPSQSSWSWSGSVRVRTYGDDCAAASPVPILTGGHRIRAGSWPSGQAELVALDVLHNQARLVLLVGDQEPHAGGAQRDQP